GVLVKLILFSVSLAVVPISIYFASEKYVFDGNSTYAAIAAVFSANIVLAAYIVASLLEDRPSGTAPAPEKKPETKKNI
ncbi:hypothetical protein PLICRDRAFT_97498, partial [Plicaturopsis crispa FD-325 SS-3]